MSNNPRWIAAIQEIGSYTVITQIFEASVDPEKTKSVRDKAFEQCDLWKQAAEIHKKLRPYRSTYFQAQGLAEYARNGLARGVPIGNVSLSDLPAVIESAEKQADEAKAACDALEAQLAPLTALLHAERDRLYMEKLQYCEYRDGYQGLPDADYERLSEKLAALGDHEKLTIEGNVIPDWRAQVYWQRVNGKLVQSVMAEIGKPIPDDAVLQENLTPEQHEEISDQMEATRIAGLTSEQKAAELENALNAAKREASLLKSDAEIADEVFDAKAWYQAKKAEVEAKYAVPEAAAKK
ncbi:hypothetical protein FACS189479_04310 [Spirochaetia bacterium]|nr:hypothetical protein FACS189479_04310 [Spirochaetia bacterium]